MSISSLPYELIKCIVRNIYDLDDLHAFALTNRRHLNACVHDTSADSPQILYDIFKRSYQNPCLLLLAATKAHQLGNWYMHASFEERARILEESGGYDALCQKAVKIFPVTLEDLTIVRSFQREVMPYACKLTTSRALRAERLHRDI